MKLLQQLEAVFLFLFLFFKTKLTPFCPADLAEVLQGFAGRGARASQSGGAGDAAEERGGRAYDVCHVGGGYH